MNYSVLKSFARHVVRLAVLLVFLVSVAGLARAQAARAASQPDPKAGAPTSASPKVVLAAEPAQPATAAERKPRGTHEGIKVHGYWVIEVRDPDGRLIQRRDFENSLTSPGAQNLPLFLSGFQVPGGWYIALTDPNNATTGSPCAGSPNPGAKAGACYLIQSTSTYEFAGGNPFCTNSGPCSSNLLVSVGNPITGLVLTGSITATQVGNVGAVGTFLASCYPASQPGNNLPFYTFSSAQCATGKSGVSNGNIQSTSFTAATLPTSNTPSTPCGGTGQISCAVNVPAAGDTINVQVTISFQ
jgi:hypothetical protein